MRAVAYLRMSSEGQETSIRDQRTALKEYAARNGIQIAKEYVDEAISGDDTDRRIAFQRMVSDGSAKKFDTVLVWDLSRLGRFDLLEAGYWLKPLRDAGVVVITLDRGKIDWTDFAGRIMWGIEQEAKHAYLRDLARNVVRGQTAAAREGRWCGGRPPFGYGIEDGRLIFGPAHAVEIVRRLFREYLAGSSLRTIAERLNIEGHRTRGGKHWEANGITAILRNRVYLGELRWGHTARGKYSRTSDPIEIIDNHPALIDAVLFDAVQQCLVSRRRLSTPMKNGGSFILSGVIRCGTCGGRMTGETENRGRSVRYRCRIHDHSGRAACDHPCTAMQAEVVQIVLDGIRKKYLSETVLKDAQRRMRDELMSARESASVRSLKEEAEDLRKKIERASQRLVEVDHDLLPIVQKHLRELQMQRTANGDALSAAVRPKREIEAIVTQRISSAVDLAKRFDEASKVGTPDQLRGIIREAIEAVTVWSTFEWHRSKRFHSLVRTEVAVFPSVVRKLFGNSTPIEQVAKLVIVSK